MNSTKDKEKKTKPSVTVGIDLGTTFSAVSYKGQIIPDGSRNTVPSVVSFSDEEILVGQPAVNEMLTNPERTVFRSKTLMGIDPSSKGEREKLEKFKKEIPYEIKFEGNRVEIVIKGKKYTPQSIAALILKKMKQVAEDGLGREVDSAVVTVPAYFNDAQRQATKEAAEIAGLEVKRIINEPTAAAIAYGLDKKDETRKSEETIAVFDLGGGTFDISILKINRGVFEVKATNGDTFLGGTDFDQRILEEIVKKFKSQNPGVELDLGAIQRIRESAINAKHALSFSTRTEISIPNLGFRFVDSRPEPIHFK
jgi:molecular chaperone DnaK